MCSSLLEQRAPISLRGIDWIVTNYSKKYNIICMSKLEAGAMINIFNSYKRALNFYKRKHFDPFRRRTRLTIHLSDGSSVETTIKTSSVPHVGVAIGCARLRVPSCKGNRIRHERMHLSNSEKSERPTHPVVSATRKNCPRRRLRNALIIS